MVWDDGLIYNDNNQMAFREAHETAGRVVARAEQLACDISEVPLEELKSIR